MSDNTLIDNEENKARTRTKRWPELPAIGVRWPEVWMRLALLFTAALVFVFLDPPDPTLFWHAAFDLGHTALFAMVMWVVLALGDRLWVPTIPATWRTPIAFTLTLVLAITSEAIQMLQPTRDANFADLLRDGAGAVMAWALHEASRMAALHRTRAIVLRGLAVAVLVAVATQFLLVLDVYARRDRAFPTLASFDGSRWENQLMTMVNATMTPRTSSAEAPLSTPAVFSLRPGRTAGFTVHEPFPDWRRYQRLVLEVRTRATHSVPLTVRIYDRSYRGGDHNAFQRIVELTGQPQRIEIPLSDVQSGPRDRELDLRQVRGVSLFLWRLSQPIELEVQRIRLE